MEGGDMEGFVCALHGKQLETFCDECGILLCPDCTGCEDHRKITFAQMKDEITSKAPNVEESKAKCQEHVEAFKKRLETYEGNVNLGQTALETLKERLENFKDDSVKDVDAFAKLKEKMAEIKGKAQTKALKTKLDELMKKTFGDAEIKEEERRINDEQARIEGTLSRDRVEFNRFYQKVLIAETILGL